MKEKAFGNYLRAHRKRAGLSQRELGHLLGYERPWQVSRHEISNTAPPLMIALGYQEIFQVPLTVIFAGMYRMVAELVERRLAELETSLTAEAKARLAADSAQKIAWLKSRRKSKPTYHLGS